MGPDAVQKYTAETSTYTIDNLEDRIDKVQTKDYVQWEEILKVASKFINNPDTSLSNKVYMQIHTGLGAAPRTGTFLKMHVVDTMTDADDIKNSPDGFYSNKPSMTNPHVSCDFFERKEKELRKRKI